jgi:hypothetical protein
MYHAIILEDLLDLLHAGRCAGRGRCLAAATEAAVAGAMPGGCLRWLQAMTHPDGEIAFFNDAAIGIAPNLAALTAYAGALGIAAEESPRIGNPGQRRLLPDSGYLRAEAGAAVLPGWTWRRWAPITCRAMRMPTRCRSSCRSGRSGWW